MEITSRCAEILESARQRLVGLVKMYPDDHVKSLLPGFTDEVIKPDGCLYPVICQYVSQNRDRDYWNVPGFALLINWMVPNLPCKLEKIERIDEKMKDRRAVELIKTEMHRKDSIPVLMLYPGGHVAVCIVGAPNAHGTTTVH